MIVTTYQKGKRYLVVGADGVEREGVYIGREEGAGVTFDVFQTQDRIPGQSAFVQVFLPVIA
jgi:hypothetical protein